MPFEQCQHRVFMALHIVDALLLRPPSSQLIKMVCFRLFTRSVLD